MLELVLAASLLGLTVRVDASSGAPRILVDGQPTWGRMFWGAPGPASLAVGKAGLIEFDFTAAASEPKAATMHFRFGQTPGEIVLDNIEVSDSITRRVVLREDFEGPADGFRKQWSVWPQGAQNTVGSLSIEKGVGQNGSAGLRVRLSDPGKNAKWPDFHMYSHVPLALEKGRQYHVRFWADARPDRRLSIAFYRPGNPFVLLGSTQRPYLSAQFASQIELAGRAGVNFVSFPVGLPWPEPNKPADWTPVDAACEAVLSVNPKALLLPRIPMDPPAWWRKTYPDDVMLWEDGPHEKTAAAVASPRYRADAAARLAALIAHLEEKFGDHVAGYHPCGQNTGEWFYEQTWLPKLSGYSPAELAAWREWLRGRYASDAALRGAWRMPQVTIGDAPLPSPQSRHAAPAGVLRDPEGERAIVDFNEFQQQMMADCVCHFARAARRASAGRKLVVFFYGYVFEFGAVSRGPAVSGHYGLRRALQSPDIDILCSPISYYDRGQGGSGPVMTAAESVALAGKLWLQEDDTSTHLSTGTPPGHIERVRNLAETNDLLMRNVSQELSRNFAAWWMDLTASGWFDHPGMWKQLTLVAPLAQRFLRTPTPFRPQVAAVIDEASMLRVAAGGTTVSRPGIYTVRAPLGRMGAPYGQYLLDDVLAHRVDARLYVLLDAWCLTPQQRKTLLAATKGKTRLWCYAPGAQEPQRWSPEAMRELTGWRLTPVTIDKAVAEPTEQGKRLGLVQSLGVPAKVRPLFAAADARPDEILARYADGSAAVVLRRDGSTVSLFAGPPGLTSELLRLAARQANVHLYTDVDCNVFANGPLLALHGAADATVRVRLPGTGPVRDVLEDKPLGQGPSFELRLRLGQTRILQVER